VTKAVEYPAMIRILFYILLFGYQTLQLCYANTSDAKNVFVSIIPQKFFVERIGGRHVNVSVMVGTGQSPETYEPSPSQMALLSESQLYFRISVPFENIWIDVIKELNTNLKLIECCAELVNIISEGHHHDVDHHIGKENEKDPHVWTSPENAKIIALIIKNALVASMPRYKSEFEDNYIRLIKDLNKLDKDIKSRLGQLNNRYMIVTHPSWGYFAEAYNLTQLPIELDGKEVRAKSLAKLIEFARSKNINRIFTQKQFNDNAAKIIAREINAKLIELNPLAEDYITNLYYVTDAIVGSEN
jgi:zinc transport system substrate-binding protein